jgi:hypothetical protein
MQAHGQQGAEEHSHGRHVLRRERRVGQLLPVLCCSSSSSLRLHRTERERRGGGASPPLDRLIASTTESRPWVPGARFRPGNAKLLDRFVRALLRMLVSRD